MVSLVFHGGHYKTGSTSLQHTLRAGESALAAAGILYPRGPADGQFTDVLHADVLNDCFTGRYDRADRYLSEVIATAEAQNCKTVLLSCEMATSFHEYPDAFAHWAEITGRLFDDIRYVFVVRDAVGYACSGYRELVRSGRASFHFDAVRGELAKQLCLQQRSIVFFRNWDSKRVTLLSYRALAAENLVRDLVRALVGFEIDPAIVAFLNTSQKKAQNIAALLLNDVYALLGAQMGQDAFALNVRNLVKAGVKRGKLRRAFDEELAARIEQAFLEVTNAYVRRVFESEQAAFTRSLEEMPADVRSWLTAES
ncbi:MAG TPA: sulfotransferase [Dongiaceae bacterium]|nr:sulfotransferase [Dongiaceae bacterium]